MTRRSIADFSLFQRLSIKTAAHGTISWKIGEIKLRIVSTVNIHLANGFTYMKFKYVTFNVINKDFYMNCRVKVEDIQINIFNVKYHTHLVQRSE